MVLGVEQYNNGLVLEKKLKKSQILHQPQKGRFIMELLIFAKKIHIIFQKED